MKRNLRALAPATTFFVFACLIISLLPISGANWQESLTISGNIESITVPPPNSSSQAGTTLSAILTAAGFLEQRDGIPVFGVRGEVCVTNGGERPTMGLSILDTVESKSGSGQFQPYVSQLVDVSAKPVLEAGEAYCYPYEVIFAPAQTDKVKYRNSVRVTILNHSGWLPGGNHCAGPDACQFGPSPNADFALPPAPSLIIETLPLIPTESSSAPGLPTEPSPTEPPPTEPPPTEPPPTEPPSTEPPPTEAPTELPSNEPPTELPTEPPPGG